MTSLLRGVRFAPSPTGRFHVGNLRTAWISERLARQLGEPWIVRFEEIDAGRVVSGAQDGQLADMAALGLRADEVVIQSERHDRHAELFEIARQTGAIYPCDCSRRTLQADLASMASAPHGDPPSYSGRCRRRAEARENSSTGLFGDSSDSELEEVQAIEAGGGSEHVGWRFRAEDSSGRDDFLIGRSFSDDVEGSFQPSYHWACAVDDYDGRYRLLVRAHDLASAAKHQRAVQAWMAAQDGEDSLARQPALYHASLIVQADGHRLEKRTKGVTLEELSVQGISTAALLRAFGTSFVDLSPGDRAPLRAGATAGETRETLTVDELIAGLG